MNILQQRLVNQQLESSSFKTPDEVVRWMGAIQSQDFAGAKWGIGQRMIRATEQSIEQAFHEGKILRTHVMRPTLHLVTSADIRWLLELTAPRVNLILASYNRRLELDRSVFKRCYKAMSKALKGNRYHNRVELKNVLENVGIKVNPQRLIHILAQAEVDGLLCSGPKKAKQMTYALFEERVPESKSKTREEALAELTLRYFRSHGPATLRDFSWWSGLTMRDVRKGLDLTKHQIMQEVSGKETYWFASERKIQKRKVSKILLLPAYDEYLIAYRDRTITIDAKFLKSNKPPFFDPTIIQDGRVIGTWRSSVSKGELMIKIKPLREFGRAENEALAKAAQKYGNFFGVTRVVAG